MTEHSDRIERALELLLYAPIGVGLFLKDTAPNFVDMFVSRGRAEIDKRHDEVQQRVTTAKSLGQVAMAFGPPIVRERVERTVDDARRRAEGLFGSPASEPAPRTETPRPEPRLTETPRTEPAGPVIASEPASTSVSASSWTSYSPPGNDDGASSASLPIPGYDALSASQVVERLIGLTPVELDAVHAYEASHRGRRTILGKIEQLAG